MNEADVPLTAAKPTEVRPGLPLLDLAPKSLTLILLAAACAVLLDGVRRHWFMTDDAYIAFRYSQNLANGHGLVFNPGERVEGYTSFLWVLLVAGGMLGGIEPEILSGVVGTICGVIVIVALSLPEKPRDFVDAAALVTGSWILACNRSFQAWCSGGLETQLFTVLVLLAYRAFFHEHHSGARVRYSSGLLGLAAWTRPEGALFFGVLALFLVWHVLTGKQTLRAAALWSLPFVVLVGGHLAFRLGYYGEVVPNTAIAKVSGAAFHDGFCYLGVFARAHAPLWIGLALGASVLLVRNAVTIVIAASLALFTVYVAYVGGDHYEFRFMVPVLPLGAWLVRDGVRKVLELTARFVRAPLRWPELGFISAVPLYSALAPSVSEPIFGCGVGSTEGAAGYTARKVRDGRLLRQFVDAGAIRSDAVLAVSGAGALPYFAGLEAIDILGLTDAFVARTPAYPEARIGHRHAAPFEYLEERRVAIMDVTNRLFVPDDYPHPLLRKFKFTSGDKVIYDVPLHAAELGGHRFLFATTLSDESLREALPGVTWLF